MQVRHPSIDMLRVGLENTFEVLNDQGVPCGSGYVMHQYSPEVYPDRPVNIYFYMECTTEAEYMLFGALVARARQLRQANPTEPARIYTYVKPGDTRKLNFYLHNGMVVSNTEDLVRLQMPLDGGPEVFNCTYAPTSLHSLQEQHALVSRMQANGLIHITHDFLQRLMRAPVFIAQTISYSGAPVGECIIVGAGDGTAELIGIYIQEQYRRQGLGKRLLQRTMAISRTEGVSSVIARIMSASQPQSRLMHAFGGVLTDQTLLFPGFDL